MYTNSLYFRARGRGSLKNSVTKIKIIKRALYVVSVVCPSLFMDDVSIRISEREYV